MLNHPLQAEHPRLEAGRDERLHQRLPGLEVLARDRQATLPGQFAERRHVDAEVRRTVRVRHTLHQRSVGVEHRGRDRLIVALHRRLEGLDRLVSLRRPHEDLGRSAPDHDHPVAAILLTEPTDILAELFGQLLLRPATLDVLAVQPTHVVLVEDRGHRLDRAQEIRDRLDIAQLQRAGLGRALVRIVGDRVPRAEDQVIERRERHEILDLGLATFRTLAQTDVTHLRERADRLRQTAARGLDPRDERGRNGAQAGQQHPQTAGRRRNLPISIHGSPLGLMSQPQRAHPTAPRRRGDTPRQCAGTR